VVKPEWGTKRECGSCGTRFYDLGRDPVLCPKCETELPATEPVRGERHVEPVAAKPPPRPKAAAVASPADDDELAGVDDGDKDEDDDASAEKEEFIEDASELGEDEDDMAEVLEGTVEEEESER